MTMNAGKYDLCNTCKEGLYDLSMTSPFRQIRCLLIIDPRDHVITLDAEKYNL